MKTNADVLLNCKTKELTNAMAKYGPIRDYIKRDTIILDLIEMFFDEKLKPEMTDAEKIILQNIGDDFTTILRTDAGFLKLKQGNVTINLNQFKDHLFQFIKKGEEYKIKDLLD